MTSKQKKSHLDDYANRYENRNIEIQQSNLINFVSNWSKK